MNTQQLKQVSKSLSYVLRHCPDSVGLELETGGWVAVDTLIRAFEQQGKRLSAEVVNEVVATSDKQRFELSDDGSRIRARQGHSVEVELGYEPMTPPSVLYHGTATRNLESIRAKGLLKGRRHHVHLSTNKQTMLQVAMRHGKPVLLVVQAALMHDAGHEFFVTGNHVWLTEHVPPQFITLSDE